MKKFLWAGLLFSIAVWGFSQEIVWEHWMALGFEGGSLIENFEYEGDSYHDYTFSPGVAISGYSWYKHIGMFARTSLLFPAYLTSEKNGAVQNDSRDDFSTMTQVAVLAGPAFRFFLGKRVAVYFGLGAGFMFSGGDASEDHVQQLSNGLSADIPGARVTGASATTFSGSLGADLGFKVDLSDVVFINVGASAAWEFLGTKEMTVEYFFSGANNTIVEAKDVTGLTIRPYIGIGFNVYAKTGWGKAPKAQGPNAQPQPPNAQPQPPNTRPQPPNAQPQPSRPAPRPAAPRRVP